MQQLQLFSLWRILGYCMVGAVVILSLAPVSMEVPVDNGDKYEHLTAYAVMMTWFLWVYARWNLRILCGVLLVVMGVGLEYLQQMTGYRTYDPADMVANTSGVCLALTAGLLGLPNGLVWAEGKILHLRSQQA